MSRLTTHTLENAPEASRALLDTVQAQLGTVPNLFRVIAASPAALAGYTASSRALARTLDVKTRERIAMAVAQVNGCDYCLSAHTYLGLNLAHLTEAELTLNRRGTSSDPKAAVAVSFARQVAKERGRVSDDELRALRAAGYTDGQVVEIVAVVAENFFTNMLNEVAKTDIDFPTVHARELA